MNIMLTVSVALLAGLLMTRVLKIFKLPAVTSYLIAGVLIGPYCIGALNWDGIGFNSAQDVAGLSIIAEIALGFIAFSIGSEFRLSELKKTGKQALVIGVVQAVAAALLVDLALYIFHIIMPDKLTVAQLITLGAIATATAPAATLMVVRQYKADGPHHLAIADGKPILRSLKKYHGKPGSGAGVEFKIKEGPITMLGITQTYDGKFKFVIGEGYSKAGPIPPTGNTNTRGFFEPTTKEFIKKWVMEGPTHHYALGIGHHADELAKIADVLGIEKVVV